MKRALILMTVLGLTLSGCGKTNLNPLQWFGKARKGAQVEVYVAPVDPRGLMDKVTAMDIEPVRSGVLVPPICAVIVHSPRFRGCAKAGTLSCLWRL